jgi:hypothetical protein
MKNVDIRVKELLRFDPEISDKEFMKSIKATIRHVCKPCWEIKYCPYGPFVEEFPLMLLTSAEAKDEDLDPEQFPEEIPEVVRMMACNVFGHVCPSSLFLKSLPRPQNQEDVEDSFCPM